MKLMNRRTMHMAADMLVSKALEGYPVAALCHRSDFHYFLHLVKTQLDTIVTQLPETDVKMYEGGRIVTIDNRGRNGSIHICTDSEQMMALYFSLLFIHEEFASSRDADRLASREYPEEKFNVKRPTLTFTNHK